MRPDPDYADALRGWTAAYDRLNYRPSLSGWFLGRSHAWLERPFGPDRHFATVVEVGAGGGQHLAHVRHRFERYVLTDGSAEMLAIAERAAARDGRPVELRREDATRLSLPDHCADRLIAAHVLEHLPEPHRVLREWHRVVKPGGVLSILLPCDPGLLWRLGRRLGPRAEGRRAGLDYDYLLAREHINPINNLITFIRYYFAAVDEDWRPFRLPAADLNLFYLCQIRCGPPTESPCGRPPA